MVLVLGTRQFSHFETTIEMEDYLLKIRVQIVSTGYNDSNKHLLVNCCNITVGVKYSIHYCAKMFLLLKVVVWLFDLWKLSFLLTKSILALQLQAIKLSLSLSSRIHETKLFHYTVQYS